MHNRLDRSYSELTSRLEKLHHTLTTEQPQNTPPTSICLFGPERYEPRYAYPLIVWLHSCNSYERELEQVMPNLSMQNYVACAPRGTRACDPCGKYYSWSKSQTGVAIAEELVFESIRTACSEFSIEKNRIFLAGFGGGASMAWRIALQHPNLFAGIISVCGEFPKQHQPLSNLAAARSLSTLWLYGEDSETCGVDHVCEALPILHAAKLSVNIRQYPCGDELLSNMLTDMNCWMMQKVTNQPIQFADTHEESFSRN